MGVQQQQVVNKARAPKPVSEARKIRKPLMEKKRRERINTSLNDLARLLTDAQMVKSESGKANKLEKADILELTVKHLKSLKAEAGTKPEKEPAEEPASTSYKEGFTKCMGVVDQTLSKAGKDTLRERLLTHLQSCLKTLQPVTSPTDASDAHTPQPSEEAQSRLAAPDAPATPATTVDAQETSTVQQEGAKEDSASEDSANPESVAKEGPRFTLVPTRLPTGAVAFLIQGGLDPRLLIPQDLTVITSSATNVSTPPPVTSPEPAAQPSTSAVQCPPTPPPSSSTCCTETPASTATPCTTPVCPPAPLPVHYQCSSPDPVQYPHPHHVQSPPTPPPSVSPQSFPREFSHFQPGASSSEEEMDTDEALSEEEEEEEEEEIDVEVEDDGPYDLSMRRMWRPW
ncbi:transcription factor HES-1-like [Penaeus japonicus]|uniref:transcription factor HES-1-like n=1 Tax=Penaeus japonicus TaxID=27405 RepID=UPI001C714DEE|nr:transcription factor HES-1-like [Penaeus japonicus]